LLHHSLFYPCLFFNTAVSTSLFNSLSLHDALPIYEEYKMVYMDRYCHIISYCNSWFYQNIYQTIKKWANEREQSFFTEMKESDLLLDYKTSAHFSLESQIKPIKDNI